MKLIKLANESFLNLLSVKLRSLLALLGILVGSASVVAMVSGGELATNEALKQFKLLGTDLLAVTLSDMHDADRLTDTQNLTLSEANHLITADEAIREVAPYAFVMYPIQFNNETFGGSVLGVTESFARVAHVNLEKGRFISRWDNYATFCVVGHTISEKIKKMTFHEAIGQQVNIGNTIFTIVGIADPWPENNFLYTNVDNAVLIPILTSTALSQYVTINNIIMRLTPDANIETVEQHITTYINQTVSNKRLYFRSAKELIARMSKQSQIFTVFLGLIGSISLIVGGIGVMNIMLVSVIERRREIGIRLAVGAQKKDIRWLFLMEASMLSLFGGILGIILGITIAYAMSVFYHWDFIFFLLPPVIGFTVSVLTGIFFGFYPAFKASNLDPIVALRGD